MCRKTIKPPRMRILSQNMAMARLGAIEGEWQEACGDMQRVTLNLEMLFEDIRAHVLQVSSVKTMNAPAGKSKGRSYLEGELSC